MANDSLSIEALSTANPRETSFMRYFAGGDARPYAVRAWTPLADIAPSLIGAIVKAEDPAFFAHHGVDWKATRAAARACFRARRVIRGGSTLTQQLARNLYLTPTRSVVRKVREMVIARRLERHLSKARILELYLNLVEWGPGVWGCAAASDYYFGKAPRDLDPFESTLLAIVLPSPKVGLPAQLAERVRRKQLSLLFQLLLSGIVRPDEFARDCDRTRAMHPHIAAGKRLREVLALRLDVPDKTDTGFLVALTAALDIAPLPPANILTSRCGRRQQGNALKQLKARFGEEAMRRMFNAEDLGLLKDHPNAPRASAVR